MQENESIYEIAKLMNEKDYIKNDIAQAVGMVTDFFKHKYLDSFRNELKAQTNAVMSAPSKEMRLFSLLKEFVPEIERQTIDRAIDAMATVYALSRIRDKMPSMGRNVGVGSAKAEIGAAYADPSVKDDGVYDIDERCMAITEKNMTAADSSVLMMIAILIAGFGIKN